MADTWKIIRNLWDTFDNNPANQRTVDAMKGMFGLLPAGAGEVASGLLAADDVRRGDYTSAALNGVGVLPFIPSMAGMVKGKSDDIAKAIKPTKYEQAHEVARQNAVKMLGLPENNTAMDRARAMGAVDWYHGSPNPDITEFNPNVARERGVDFGPATWVTKSPSNASGYSLNWDSYKKIKDSSPEIAEDIKRNAQISSDIVDAFNSGDESLISSLKSQLDDTYKRERGLYNNFMDYEIPSEGSTVYPLVMLGDNVKWVDGGGQNFMKTHGKEVPLARQEEYDAVRINNTQDNSGSFNGLSDVAAVFNPARLRSRFAAFDPARINEPDLLGRVNIELLPWLTGAGLLGAGGMYYSGE